MNAHESREPIHADAADRIPFRKLCLAGTELSHVQRALSAGDLSGGGVYAQRCQAWMEQRFGAPRVLLTNSCTAALEMAALLFDVAPGDEIVMPSYTFPSLANAFVLRGAVPVFVDIRRDTLCLDETKIEAALTPRTRAIGVAQCGGGCAMDEIRSMATRHGLRVVEDAALGFNATHGDRFQGTLGDVGTFSFQGSKACAAGEGGALVLNDAALIARAEILWEKGTDKLRFQRGEVGEYRWVDLGGSYLPSELVAAFLFAQLEAIDTMQERRVELFDRYGAGLTDLEDEGRLALPPRFPTGRHNGQAFWIVLGSKDERVRMTAHLKQRGIAAVPHYVPLHSSPFGRVGRTASAMDVTDAIAAGLLRLPLYPGLTEPEQDEVIDGIHRFFAS